MKNNHSPIVEESSQAKVEHLETIDDVVLYDTIATGKRGLSILAGMTGILEEDLVEIRPRPWRLDLLQDPSAAENATQDANTAHVIILSISGDTPLSPAFKNWFSGILAQRQNNKDDVAVVALLELAESSMKAIASDFHFIKQITLEAELDFFSPHFDAQYPVKSGFAMDTALDRELCQRTNLLAPNFT